MVSQQELMMMGHSIAQREQQLGTARTQAEGMEPRIFQTRSQLMGATPTSQVGVKQAQFQREQFKETAVEQIKRAQEEFQKQAQPVKEYIEQVKTATKETNEWKQAQQWVEQHPELVQQLPDTLRAKAEYILKETSKAANYATEKAAEEAAKYQEKLYNLVQQWKEGAFKGENVFFTPKGIEVRSTEKQLMEQKEFDATINKFIEGVKSGRFKMSDLYFTAEGIQIPDVNLYTLPPELQAQVERGVVASVGQGVRGIPLPKGMTPETVPKLTIEGVKAIPVGELVPYVPEKLPIVVSTLKAPMLTETPAKIPWYRQMGQEYLEATKGYSLLDVPSAIPGYESKVPSPLRPSVTGTLEFLGVQAAKLVPKQPVAIEDIRYTGSIGPQQKLLDISPYERETIVARKTASAKQAAAQTAMTAPFIVVPYLGTSAMGIASEGLIISGLEQYATPKGQKILGEAAKTMGPIAYALPAVEIGLGVMGVKQAYLKGQSQALSIANPSLQKGKIGEVSLGVPYRVGKEWYLQQAAATKIPIPGFKYNAIPFYEEKAFGMAISPTQRAGLIAKLKPTSVGGFTYEGVAMGEQSLYSPFTNKLMKPITGPLFPISGEVIPGIQGKYVKPQQAVFLKTPFSGRLETPSKSSFFVGGKVKDIRGISQVVSGQATKIRVYKTGGLQLLGEPTTKSFIAPDITIEPYKEFPFLGKKGQFSFPMLRSSAGEISVIAPRTTSKSISVTPSRFTFGKTLTEGITQQIFTAPETKFIFSTSPLFKFPEVNVTKEILSLVPKNILITKQILIPKSLETNKEVLVPKEIFVSRGAQLQVPTQIIVPKEIVVQKEIIAPKQVTKVISFIPQITTYPPGWFLRRKKVLEEEVIKRRGRRKPTGFIPYGRRYGKFKALAAKPVAFEEARAKGVKFLKTTLGATIELRKPSGERVPVGELTPEFRYGKKGKDIFQLVQKKPLRLGTREEKAEIRLARRRIKFL